MIGAVVLAAGLLLILAGLVSARIPGGASFARSGIDRSPGAGDDATGGLFAFARRGRDPVRAFLLSPIHPATWYANAAIAMGLFVGVGAFVVIAAFVSTGFTLILALIGVLFIVLAIEGSRLVARIERWRAFIGEPVRPAAHPYRPLRGGIRRVLRAEFADESRWRDVLYVAINLPLSIIEFLVAGSLWIIALSLLTSPVWYDAVAGASQTGAFGPLAGHGAPVVVLRAVLGLALLPVAASLSQVLMALHRAVVAGLLCTSESRELRRQVETLRESRSAVLDVEASELHRIERDLHDGAQQRLVMLTIDLGLASERIDDDPAAAKQLILEGQEQAREALAEIRDLVRGIAPSILLDRGLVVRDRVDLRAGAGAHDHRQRPRPGRAASAVGRADRLLRRHRGAGQRRQAQRRPALRGALPPGGRAAGRRGLGRRDRRGSRRARRWARRPGEPDRRRGRDVRPLEPRGRADRRARRDPGLTAFAGTYEPR